MGKHQKLQPTEVQSLQKFKHPSEMVSINTVKLTEVQIKTWLAMLYHSVDNFKAETHEIRIEELNASSGYAKKDTQYLIDTMAEFCGIVVKFNTLGKSKQNLSGVITSLLAGVDFDKKPGYVTFAFSPMLKEIIENSKMFSNLSLALVRNIETKAALALYALANDYRGIHKIPETSLEKLRGILGVDEGEYPEFRAFNQWVLKPACKQVKEKTDLEVIPHFFRGAHGKVLSVTFEIKEQRMPLLVKPKPMSNQKEDKKKRETRKNPYGHLTDLEARSELSRLKEEENKSNTFTPENQKRKALLTSHIHSLGGAV